MLSFLGGFVADFEFPLLIKLFICFYGTIYTLLVITFCIIL
jgi:hypothetical protein